jgi:hypothetical protein
MNFICSVLVAPIALATSYTVCAESIHNTIVTNSTSDVQSVIHQSFRGQQIVFSQTKKIMLPDGVKPNSQEGIPVSTSIEIFYGTNVVYSWKATSLGVLSWYSSDNKKLRVSTRDEDADGTPDVITVVDVDCDYYDIIVRDDEKSFKLVDQSIVDSFQHMVKSGSSFMPIYSREWLLNRRPLGADRENRK